jgi:hypothetical protein
LTYTGVPWTVDHFVISMFPAIFGQFASEESMAAAARFLLTYIMDLLIDRFVRSYLLNCFLFRARLGEAFFYRLGGAASNDAFEEYSP